MLTQIIFNEQSTISRISLTQPHHPSGLLLHLLNKNIDLDKLQLKSTSSIRLIGNDKQKVAN